MTTDMRMGTVTTAMTADPLLTLHQLLSPAFPVGAFAYSHGLESAVADGAVTDAATLEHWLRDVLEHGSGWSDAVFAARAAQGGDLAELAALAAALTVSAERRQETLLQGAAFAATVREVWGVAVPDAPYPVAFGAAVAALDLPVEDAVRLSLMAFASNLVSAGLRLMALGQTDGQRIVTALQPLCAALAARAAQATLDDLGGFVPAHDLQSMRHGALYSKLFRS